MLIRVLLAVFALSSLTPAEPTSIVSGVVSDMETSSPIPFATVKLIDGGQSTLTNEKGEYRLRLSPGMSVIKFSHISYFSQIDTIRLDSVLMHDVMLRPSMIELKGSDVFSRAADPAQRIILEAIKRKKEILERLHDYQFDAYARLTLTAESGKDSGRIAMITETQSTSLWERTDKYKEILHARKQTANIKADDNLVTVGELLNFNENRLDIGQYRVVSPTATDALDYYNYYLLDTVEIDNRPVFLLEMEPKNEMEPCFTGTIMIADSIFSVVAVDVGLSKGVATRFIRHIRYSQRTTDFQDDVAMPSEIRFSGELHLPIALPNFPRISSMSYVASISNYQFDKGHPKQTFDDYEMTIAPDVDEIDSIRWSARQLIPLSPVEVASYQRIDSVEKAPKPLGKQLLLGTIGLLAIGTGSQPDLFRFNRVEGPYAGLGIPISQNLHGIDLVLKGGRAFDAKLWEYRVDAGFTFSRKDRFGLLVSWYDEVERMASISGTGRGASTFLALGDQSDPRDYYRARGADITLSRKLLPRTTARISYHDAAESPLPVSSDFSFFSPIRDTLANRQADNGRMRSASLDIRFDSRRYIPLKNRDEFSPTNRFVQFGLQFSVADNDLASTAKEYRRAYAWLYWSNRLLPYGTTQLLAFGGQSDGDLPNQQLFTAEYGGGFTYNLYSFQTLQATNLVGDEIAGIYISHFFGRRLWIASGIPGVKDIPFGLQLFGGVAATDLRDERTSQLTSFEAVVQKPYSEVGFRITNLTPFLGLFNFAFSAKWQLSDYADAGDKSSWGFDISPFGD